MKLSELTKPNGTKKIKVDTSVKNSENNVEKSTLNLTDQFPIEPLKNNRFLITFPEVDVRPYLFRNYEMYNEGEKFIFTTDILETVGYTFNPKDFFKITSVKLEYLDPVGEPVGGFIFNVKGSNFRKKGNYSDDELQIVSFVFSVDVDSIQNLYVYDK